MIPFSQYFSSWLYGEGGYYTDPGHIGKAGDFYTAVSASRFFGGAIANKIYRMIREGKLGRDCSVVEIGAERSYLMADIIQFLYTLDSALLESLSFTIVEPLPQMRQVQEKYLQESFGDAVNFQHVAKLSDLPDEEAFIIGNEVLDALPCELIHQGKMAYVNDENKIIFTEANPKVLEMAERYGITKGEVPTGLPELMEQLSHLRRVEVMWFDYGEKLPAGEFTVRIYRKHEVFPLFEEGLELDQLYQKSDLTYDVCFQAVEAVMQERGFKLEAFSSQAKAMVEFGIIELLELLKQNSDERTFMQESNKLRTLLDPSLMGERFKMVHFSKGRE